MRTETLRRTAVQLSAQWAGFLTIFLVLTAGSAYALDGTNTVFSNDIVDGAVTTADVANGSLTGRDAWTLHAGDIAIDGLGTGQVSESSLGAVPVADQAGMGRFGGGGVCSESSSYVDCGRQSVDLAKPGRLLIIAAVNTGTGYFVEDVRGPCRLEVNGAPIEASETYFKYDDEGEETPIFDAVEGAGQAATLTAVSHVYPIGRQVVGVECALVGDGEAINGDDGHASASTDISVVALSDG